MPYSTKPLGYCSKCNRELFIHYRGADYQTNSHAEFNHLCKNCGDQYQAKCDAEYKQVLQLKYKENAAALINWVENK